ncbi:YybH family protein [Mucilaginibacter litoreus]|uniref:YybH family protein n=1 Tax=Mucilaginibacter litoreus TaxID=1048221 RepID=A0ABW3AWL0_9SPHI
MSENKQTAEISKLIAAYTEAINNADHDTLTGMFSENGVLMPQGAPAVTGGLNILAAYQNMLSAFKLQVSYEIDDIGGDDRLAVVRTHSTGSSKIKSSGTVLPVNNKEIFILENMAGQWKINSYIFNNNSKP